MLDCGGAAVLLTPTQALLLYPRRFGNESEAALRDELTHLVWEQPANLDKV